MKKMFAIVVLMCVMMFAGSVFAAPFLVSDPTPAGDEVTNFKIFMDAAPAVDSVPDATKAVKYDLSGVSAGTHTVKVQACNVWGCSVDSTPFTFTKKIPGVPATLHIAP